MLRLWMGKIPEKMAAPWTKGHTNQPKVVSHTLTGLKRWSCHSRELPRKLSHFSTIEVSDPVVAVNNIRAIHVYDFDNTRK